MLRERRTRAYREVALAVPCKTRAARTRGGARQESILGAGALKRQAGAANSLQSGSGGGVCRGVRLGAENVERSKIAGRGEAVRHTLAPSWSPALKRSAISHGRLRAARHAVSRVSFAGAQTRARRAV